MSDGRGLSHDGPRRRMHGLTKRGNGDGGFASLFTAGSSPGVHGDGYLGRSVLLRSVLVNLDQGHEMKRR